MAELLYNCSKFERDLKPQKVGFYCRSCDRCIIDFRGKTADEIRNIQSKTDRPVCGVFDEFQITNKTASKIHSWFKLAFAAVFVVGLTFNASGQVADSTVTKQISIDQQHDQSVVFQGVVSDAETGEPVPIARVYLKYGGNEYLVRTNFDGEYRLRIDQELAVGDQFDLYFTGIFYDSLMVKVSVTDQKQNMYVVNAQLSYENDLQIVGLVIPVRESVRDRDPNSYGKTVIKGEDLRRF
ncbi:MAG: hypothetical protein ACPG21_12265 [Crocinitomicaceae bacterium]